MHFKIPELKRLLYIQEKKKNPLSAPTLKPAPLTNSAAFVAVITTLIPQNRAIYLHSWTKSEPKPDVGAYFYLQVKLNLNC